jgi:all-trans-retinol 13,14-reductase
MKASKNLYKRFNPNENYENFDHIIIGSGIGGLTTATWLAKAGKKVLVLERHYVPGGFTHVFKRRSGFKWDVGVHYVGNVSKSGSLRKLFDFITDSKLKWDSIGDVYDVIHIDDQIYEFKSGEENFKKHLLTYFPDEENTITLYLTLIHNSNKRANSFFLEKTFEPFLSKMFGWIIVNRFHKYSKKTTLEVLQGITNNKRLIAVLCAQCGNYGLSPKYSSFAAHALIVGHFMDGGHYPNGGSDQIADTIIDVLYENNGELYVSAEVSKIVVVDNKVMGVKVKDKFIACNSVISNVGINNTFNHLLTQESRDVMQYNFKDLEPSTGHMCLYVGLDKSDLELNLPKHNIWYFQDENLDTIFESDNIKNAASKFSYISFPSSKDREWKVSHPNQATIQVISLGDYSWFKNFENQVFGKRSVEYKNLKKEYSDLMLDRLYLLFPQIREHVVKIEVSTPLSTKHFSNYKSGEVYGISHTPKRFDLRFLRPKTKIKGLVLVGQDITIVGVAGAMISGMLAAITILKFKVILLFISMNKLK